MHWPWSKFSFLLDEPSPRPSMSTRSLLTSESFNALRVTSAIREEWVQCNWVQSTSCLVFSPAVFCFFMGMDIEGLLCMLVDTTCEVGTVIIAGVAGAGAGGVATAAFLTVFLGDSDEIGTLLSSYNFLFTVLLIWALQKRTALGHAYNWIMGSLFKRFGAKQAWEDDHPWLLTQCVPWSQCWCCSGRHQSVVPPAVASRSQSLSTWPWGWRQRPCRNPRPTLSELKTFFPTSLITKWNTRFMARGTFNNHTRKIYCSQAWYNHITLLNRHLVLHLSIVLFFDAYHW